VKSSGRRVLRPVATISRKTLVQWVRHVLAVACAERGVFAFGGIMVDAPVLRRAERIVQLVADAGS
jgi:citrate lyase beta subunit